jgi:tetratricopeptide (TPR) repeat protein
MSIVRRARLLLATKRKTYIAVGIILLVLIVASGVLINMMNNTGKGASPTVGVLPDKDIPATLEKYAADGRIDEGMDYIDSQIDAETNQTDKRDLLVYKSQFATKAGRTDVALESAKEASSIEPDLTSDLALAEAYEKSGDKSQAVKYYQQVVDSIEDDTFMSRYKHIWVEKVEELSS